jgi:hypothetical protein
MSASGCVLCGREQTDEDYGDFILIGVPGGAGYLCGGCQDRPVSDVVKAFRRKQADQKFAAQAEREVTELTRDPGMCKEWIEKMWEKGRYCSPRRSATATANSTCGAHGL